MKNLGVKNLGVKNLGAKHPAVETRLFTPRARSSTTTNTRSTFRST